MRAETERESEMRPRVVSVLGKRRRTVGAAIKVGENEENCEENCEEDCEDNGGDKEEEVSDGERIGDDETTAGEGERGKKEGSLTPTDNDEDEEDDDTGDNK